MSKAVTPCQIEPAEPTGAPVPTPLMLSLAMASDPAILYAGPSVQNTPIAEILQMSAVVVEGPLVEQRHDIWLGPSGPSSLLVWRIAVEEELLGHVESGYVDLVVGVEWPPILEEGDRVLVMANVRTLYLPYYNQGRTERYEVFPAYDDSLVPTLPGTLLYRREREDLWSAPHSLGGADWLPQDADARHELTWSQVVARLRPIAASCNDCGATVPGALEVP